MSADEIQRVAARAADEAIARWLVTLGINARDPDDIIEMQKDFAYVRSWRQSIATVKTKGLGTAVAVLVAGLLGAIYMALRGH